VRTFISTPAGAAHMNLTKFTLYTAAGCIPWVLLLGVIGVEVGERWEEWRDKLHYFDYAVIAAIIGLVIYLLIRRRGGGETAKADQDTQGEGRRGEPRGEAKPATEA
jgi:membrane protein DedA with SNARE-associated domain